VLWRRESRPALALVTVGAIAMIALPAGTGAGATGQVSVLRGEQASYATRARGALLSLYALDSRLAQAKTQLASLRHQAAQVAREFSTTLRRTESLNTSPTFIAMLEDLVRT